MRRFGRYSALDVTRRLVREQPAAFVLATGFILNALRLGLAGPALDFGNIWLAGKSIVSGTSPYAAATHVGDFVQPPATALFATPFGLLPLHLAGQLVVALSVAALVAAVLASSATVPREQAAWSAAIALVGLGISSQLVQNLDVANTDVIAAGFMGAAVLALHQARELSAGCMLGVGLSVKPTMALFLLLPLILWQWRPLVAAAAVILLANLAGLLLIPHATRFFSSVLPYITAGNTGGYNVSLKAALDRLGAPETVVLAARIVAAGMAGRAVYVHRLRFAHEPAVAAVFLTATTCLVSSYFFSRYFIYLAAGAGALYVIVSASKRTVTLFTLAAFVLVADIASRSSNHAVDVLLGFRWVFGSVLCMYSLVVAMRETRGAGSETRPSLPPAVTTSSSYSPPAPFAD